MACADGMLSQPWLVYNNHETVGLSRQSKTPEIIFQAPGADVNFH
jgi:hypothetical protein